MVPTAPDQRCAIAVEPGEPDRNAIDHGNPHGAYHPAYAQPHGAYPPAYAQPHTPIQPDADPADAANGPGGGPAPKPPL